MPWRSREKRFVIVLKCWIEPVSWLSWRSMTRRFVRAPNDAGIGPVRALSSKLSIMSIVQLPTCGGILPVYPPLRRNMNMHVHELVW